MPCSPNDLASVALARFQEVFDLKKLKNILKLRFLYTALSFDLITFEYSALSSLVV